MLSRKNALPLPERSSMQRGHIFSALLSIGVAITARSADASPVCIASSTLSPTTNVTFPSSGRSFVLATPSGSISQPLRLLYALHGYGDGADFILKRTGFDTSAPAAGYAVVAPQGDAGNPGGSWSLGNGRTDGRQTDRIRLSEEIDFLWSVADCLRDQLGIPLSGEVYLAGLSQGGKMATRLACSTHAGFTVKAIAVAAGVQAEPGISCPAAIPLLLFQGGLDPVVPFCTTGSFLYRPNAASLSLLARSTMNGCAVWPAQPRGASSMDVISTRVFEYQGCAAPTMLVWTPLDAHVWPDTLIGVQQTASAVALAFFASSGRDAVIPQLTRSDARWPCGQQWT